MILKLQVSVKKNLSIRRGTIILELSNKDSTAVCFSEESTFFILEKGAMTITTITEHSSKIKAHPFRPKA